MASGPLSARVRQMRYMVGLLRYDEPQALSSAQRTQARVNIGAADASTAALAAREVNAKTGLKGGGDLTQDRDIEADIATQAEAQAGTSAAKLMTPQRTAQAVSALTIGRGQSWQTPARAVNTTYQNDTGAPIMVSIQGRSGISEVSANGTSGWVRVGEPVSDSRQFQSFIVPPGHHYRCRDNGGALIYLWSELR